MKIFRVIFVVPAALFEEKLRMNSIFDQRQRSFLSGRIIRNVKTTEYKYWFFVTFQRQRMTVANAEN